MEIGTLASIFTTLYFFYHTVVRPGRWGAFFAKLAVGLALYSIPLALLIDSTERDGDIQIAMATSLLSSTGMFLFIDWTLQWQTIFRHAFYMVIFQTLTTIYVLYSSHDGLKLRHATFLVRRFPRMVINFWIVTLPETVLPAIKMALQYFYLKHTTNIDDLQAEPKTTLPVVYPDGTTTTIII